MESTQIRPRDRRRRIIGTFDNLVYLYESPWHHCIAFVLDQNETTKLKDAVTACMGRSDSTQRDLVNKIKGKKGPPNFKGWSRLRFIELDPEDVGVPPVYLDE